MSALPASGQAMYYTADEIFKNLFMSTASGADTDGQLLFSNKSCMTPPIANYLILESENMRVTLLPALPKQ